MAGVTRDRREGSATLADLEFIAIDTAGLEEVYGYLHKERPEHYTQLLGNKQPLALELQSGILQQTAIAVQEADVVLFLMDARDGVTGLDGHFAKWIRKYAKVGGLSRKQKKVLDAAKAARVDSDEAEAEADTVEQEEAEAGVDVTKRPPKPIVLVANKCEDDSSETVRHGIREAISLGFGEPIAISAGHNQHMASLHTAIAEAMETLRPWKEAQAQQCEEELARQQSEAQEEDARTRIRVCIAGKPNVGKSTMVNRLLGQERVLTGSQPGVTRDSIAVEWEHEDFPKHRFELVDTAGLKGVTRLAHSRLKPVDSMAMQDSLSAMEFANVVVMVVDSTDGLNSRVSPVHVKDGDEATSEQQEQARLRVEQVLSHADLKIARRVLQDGRVLIVVANKWDLCPAEEREGVELGLRLRLDEALPEAKGVLLLCTSALTGEFMDKLVGRVVEQYDKWDQRLSTGVLNRWLTHLTNFRPHPKIDGRAVSFKFLTQLKGRPPTFAMFCNRKTSVQADYVRFVTNALRTEFGFEGVPIRLLVRSQDNPYLDEKGNKK